jgi:hypothetical protein
VPSPATPMSAEVTGGLGRCKGENGRGLICIGTVCRNRAHSVMVILGRCVGSLPPWASLRGMGRVCTGAARE